MNYVWIYIVFSAATVMAIIGVYIWIPDFRVYLYVEDKLIENLGAIILISTFILGIPFSIIRKQHRVMLICISLFSLLGFLIEVGFGKRLFIIKMPAFGWKIINVFHDSFSMGYQAIKGIYESHTFLFYFLIGSSVMLILLLLKKFGHKFIGLYSKGNYTQTYVLAMFFMVLFFTSLVLDIASVHKVPLIVLEEMIEMLAAAALLFCLLSLYRPKFFKRV